MQFATPDHNHFLATTVSKTASPTSFKSPEELAQIVSRFSESEGWMDRVRLRTKDRWYERLYRGADYDIWAISWLPGQSTGFHDHGDSAGAFVVATGVLEEHRPGKLPITVLPNEPRSFDREYAHDVRNVSLAPAVSIHAYSPPLNEMNEYELQGDELIASNKASERAIRLNEGWRTVHPVNPDGTESSNIDRMLSAAREQFARLSPVEAYEATIRGATLVDIRPAAQRAVEGSIPGALIIERNVLEWRLDPTSDAKLPIATDYELQIVVFCSEGYTSSLAAAALNELGLRHATDIIGGFKAWLASGFPTTG